MCSRSHRGSRTIQTGVYVAAHRMRPPDRRRPWHHPMRHRIDQTGPALLALRRYLTGVPAAAGDRVLEITSVGILIAVLPDPRALIFATLPPLTMVLVVVTMGAPASSAVP